jgi:hypothetical protein
LNIKKILTELRQERRKIDEAIATFEELSGQSVDLKKGHPIARAQTTGARQPDSEGRLGGEVIVFPKLAGRTG